MQTRYITSLAAVAAGIVTAAGSSLFAQDLTYTVHDSVAMIEPNWTYDFKTEVINTSKSKVTFRVVRTEMDYPGSDWQSWICTDQCFAPEVSTPPAVDIPAGGTLECKLTIFTGASPGTGHVKLVFTEGVFGANPVEKEFSATMSSTSGVEDRSTGASKLRPAYPNPALSIVMVPIGDGFRAPSSASLKLYDPNGTMVGDYSDQARQAAQGGNGTVALDVSSLPAGTYLYQLAVDGQTRTASFVVAH